MTLYAVGDLHGQLAELDRALTLIAADGSDDAEIVFLGDYVDRGPDSRGVIERLRTGLAEGRNWRCLLGNHDRMFLRFVSEAEQNDASIKSGIGWLNYRLGGIATLASYGLTLGGPPRIEKLKDGRERAVQVRIDGQPRDIAEAAAIARDRVPPEHLEFIAGLPLMHVTDELLFVHAGIRPGVALEAQVEEDLIWIRAGFLDDDTDHGRLVIHGHTVVEAPMHLGNRVALDTGAGYGEPVTAAAFDGRDVFVLTAKGRVPLLPPE